MLIKYPIYFVFWIYVSGVFVAEQLPSTFYLYASIFFLLLNIIFLFMRNSKFNVLKIICFYFFVFTFASSMLYQKRYDATQKVLPNYLLNKKLFVKGEVIEVEKRTQTQIRFVMKVISLQDPKTKVKFDYSHKLLTTINYDKFHQKFYENTVQLGNVIQVEGKIKKPQGAVFPGDFNYKDYLEWKDIYYAIQCDEKFRFDVLSVSTSKINIPVLIGNLRLKLIRQIYDNFSPNSAFLVSGLVTGDRSEIPQEVTMNFINTGVIHVLAVSGQHVVYILIILLAIFGRFKILVKSVVVIVSLVIFNYLTGNTPSVVRAVIMSACWLFSEILERKSEPLNTLAISGLIILLIEPRDLFNASFLLSFGAVFSLVVIYPKFDLIKRKLIEAVGNKKLFVYIFNILFVTLSAQLGTLGFVISYFEKVSLISLLANVVIIPLVGLILASSILSIVVLNILPLIFNIYRDATELLIRVCLDITDWLSKPSFAYFDVGGFSWMNFIAYYLVLVMLWIVYRSKLRTTLKAAVCILLVVNFFLFYDLFEKKYFPSDSRGLILIGTNSFYSVIYSQKGESLVLLKMKNKMEDYQNFTKEIQKHIKVIQRVGLNKNLYISALSNDSVFQKQIDEVFGQKQKMISIIDNKFYNSYFLSSRNYTTINYGNFTLYTPINFNQNAQMKFIIKSNEEDMIILTESIKGTGEQLEKITNNKVILLSNSPGDVNECEIKNTNELWLCFDKLEKNKYYGTKIWSIKKDKIEEIEWGS